MIRRTHSTGRPGMSLLEVMTAMAIFLMALIVIGRLIVMSTDMALDVQYQSQAAQMCQSKLAEVVAGAVPLNAQNDVPFDEDPDWKWSLDCEQGSVTGLWTVTVKVVRERGPNQRNECLLSQMMLDPSIKGSALDAAASASSSSTGTSGATTPSASSGSGTGSGATTPSSGSAAGSTASPSKSATTGKKGG